MTQVFWRTDSCTVDVGYTEAGELRFSGHDRRAFGTPGHHYSYDVSVPSAQFPALRRALGVDQEADVLAAVVARVDDVMPGGEAAWLTAHGIVHQVSGWDDPPD